MRSRTIPMTRKWSSRSERRNLMPLRRRLIFRFLYCRLRLPHPSRSTLARRIVHRPRATTKTIQWRSFAASRPRLPNQVRVWWPIGETTAKRRRKVLRNKTGYAWRPSMLLLSSSFSCLSSGGCLESLLCHWPSPLFFQKEKVQSPPLDYFLHEPDLDDSAPLEAYHHDILELQLQQVNGWLMQIRVPLRQKDLYKSTFQRFSETRKTRRCVNDFPRLFLSYRCLARVSRSNLCGREETSLLLASNAGPSLCRDWTTNVVSMHEVQSSAVRSIHEDSHVQNLRS